MSVNTYAFVLMHPVQGEEDIGTPVIHEECGETVAYAAPGGSIGGINNTINTHVCPQEN
jgi:hypothetical protein